jgi:molybdate transport system substrate-binding protein
MSFVRAPRRRLWLKCAGLVVAAIAAGAPAVQASEVRLAVATNFVEVIGGLKPLFEAKTGHRLTLTTGSTGKLYAQIRNGAPFDVLLAADAQTPQRLVNDGEAVAASRFTYAFGRLALWSSTPGRVGADGVATLRDAKFRHLAIANPELAPYGSAAREMLRATGLWEAVQTKLVYAQNVVASGNAEFGLIAYSQVKSRAGDPRPGPWLVPAALHAPIRQDAVLLTHAQANEGARAFLEALKSPEIRQLIESFGYATQ